MVDSVAEAAGPSPVVVRSSKGCTGVSLRDLWTYRITAHLGEAVTFIVRNGNFASRDEAEVKGQELAHLGPANHVVRVR